MCWRFAAAAGAGADAGAEVRCHNVRLAAAPGARCTSVSADWHSGLVLASFTQLSGVRPAGAGAGAGAGAAHAALSTPGVADRSRAATVDAAVGGGGASAAGAGAAGTGGGVGGGMSDVDVSDCELGIFMHDGCVRLCVLRMCCVDLLITDSLLNEARDSVKCLCALERYTESL